jgi:excisionase family DNA binding protein
MPTNRLTLTRKEAAASLGVSVDYLDDHVLPEICTVRRGRLRLIPVSELEAWLASTAKHPATLS